MKKVNLESIYDARASFYGKAKIAKDTMDGQPGFTLFSYDTPVAFAYVTYGLGECNYGCAYHVIDPDSKEEINVKHPGWSQTTNRHIREFYTQFMNHDITVSNYGYME